MHWGDDVGWREGMPEPGEWRHLVYTCENRVVQIFVDGKRVNILSLDGDLLFYRVIGGRTP